MISKRLLQIAAPIILAAGISACGTIKNDAIQGKKAPLSVHTAEASLPSPEKKYIGVYEKGAPRSYQPINKFADKIGQRPSIALYYSAWYTPFQGQFAQTAYSHGAATLVQIQPNGISLQSLANGQYDHFLTSYADQVRAFGHPVVLSFGHEMNGTWYSWGAGHVAPSVFIAAWRHVVSLFRAAGADNVTWMWTVNSLTAASGSLSQWWPGSAWVNWIGIDGYYIHSTDTFQLVFGNTLNEIRGFTNKPVLISETGAGPQPGQVTQIQGLFNSVQSDDLLGIVWFDQGQNHGIFHQDWRLEDSPGAMSAFRAGVKAFGPELAHV